MNSNHSTPLFYRSKVRKALWNLLIFFCTFPIVYELISEKRYSYFAKDGFIKYSSRLMTFGVTPKITLNKILIDSSVPFDA